MVKHVVKPLFTAISRESRVPKKSVFTRAFGVFCFLGECGRCPAPKASALPIAPHLDNIQLFFAAIVRLFFLNLRALPVVTKAQASQSSLSPSHCHSLCLASSATGGASATSPIAPHLDVFIYSQRSTIISNISPFVKRFFSNNYYISSNFLYA